MTRPWGLVIPLVLSMVPAMSWAQDCYETIGTGPRTQINCEPPIPSDRQGNCAPTFMEDRPTTAGQPGQLERVTMPFWPALPAVCNDGTHPIWYVRESPAPAGDPDHDRFLFVFEAGGSALEANRATLDLGFQDRWLGVGRGANCRQKVSTDVIDNTTGLAGRDGIVDPQHQLRIVGDGVFEPTSDNPFENWNWVYLNYCSSDTWQGTNSVILEDLRVPHSPPTGSEIRREGARVYFHGRRILRRVLMDLDDGNVNIDATTDGDGGTITRTLTPLQSATDIVLVGGGTGAGGPLHNVDWVASQYPDASVMALIGATLTPDLGAGDRPWAVDDDLNDVADLREDSELRLTKTDRFGGVLDDSCEALAASNPNFSRWKCQLLTFLEKRDEITSPHLIRQDMTDTGAMWSASDFKLGIEDNFEPWVNQGLPTHFMGPDLGEHVIYLDDQYYDTSLVLCDSTVSSGPVLHSWSYASMTDDFLARYRLGAGFTPLLAFYDPPLSQAYDGLDVTWSAPLLPPADLVWETGAVCPPRIIWPVPLPGGPIGVKLPFP